MRIWRVLIPVFVLASAAFVAVPAQADGNGQFLIAEATTVQQIVASDDYQPDTHGDVLRLYRAFFDREPDVSGAKYWINTFEAGGTLVEIAEYFTGSQEYANNYNGTDNREFLTRVYANVLGRGFDQSGFDYWLDTLQGTNNSANNPELKLISRGEVVRWVTASDEFKTNHPYTPDSLAPTPPPTTTTTVRPTTTTTTTTTVKAPPAVAPPAPTGLVIKLWEDPFVCDGAVREFGRVTGARAGERITFTSPQVGNLLPGTANASGELVIQWQCNMNEVGTTWTLNARGTSSGKTGSVRIRSKAPGENSNSRLTFNLTENPFRCDGGLRYFGTVNGARPGERITFTSPQVGSLLPGTADGNGTLRIRWQCNPSETGDTWVLNARSESGRTGSVTIRSTGATAPTTTTNTTAPTTTTTNPPKPTTTAKPRPPATLEPGQSLRKDGSILSGNGECRLRFQLDGNIVLLDRGRAIWATGTPRNTDRLTNQGDGNIVAYAGSRAVWSSGTNTGTKLRLQMQNDCNLVAYVSGKPFTPGNARWATNTDRPPSDAKPKATLRKGAPNGTAHWYDISLTGFQPNSKVTLRCFQTGSGAFYSEPVTIRANGTYSDSKLCFSTQGPGHWVTVGGVRSNTVNWGPGASPTPPIVDPPIVDPPVVDPGGGNPGGGNPGACEPSNFGPEGGAARISQNAWSDIGGDWAIVKSTVSFRFTPAQIDNIKCSGSISFELDMVIDGIDDVPLLNRSPRSNELLRDAVWSSNLPDAYLDTEASDNTPNRRVFTVGTAHADRLQANVIYNITIEKPASGFATSAYVVSQRGRWAKNPIEKALCAANFNDPAWCVFSEHSRFPLGQGNDFAIEGFVGDAAWGVLGPFPVAD